MRILFTAGLDSRLHRYHELVYIPEPSFDTEIFDQLLVVPIRTFSLHFFPLSCILVRKRAEMAKLSWNATSRPPTAI